MAMEVETKRWEETDSESKGMKERENSYQGAQR